MSLTWISQKLGSRAPPSIFVFLFGAEFFFLYSTETNTLYDHGLYIAFTAALNSNTLSFISLTWVVGKAGFKTPLAVCFLFDAEFFSIETSSLYEQGLYI
jgi:hypothetical protein